MKAARRKAPKRKKPKKSSGKIKSVIFGGAGFVGSHVADALSHAGHQVLVFDRKPSRYLTEDQKMMVGDIMDPEAVQKAVRGADYVYHFAGIADLGESNDRPFDTIHQNITATLVLLLASLKARVKRFVYASTIYVYSNKGGFYRCSKQSAEGYIEEFHNQHGLDYTILRYGTLFGPRADERNSIYRYLNEAVRRKRINCPASGEEVRDYIYVRDAARLSVDILQEKYKNQPVVITGHHPMKFKRLMRMIKEILSNDLTIKYRPQSDFAHYDITPYSFIPKIGLKLTTDYYTDLGQGLLECIEEIYHKTEKAAKKR